VLKIFTKQKNFTRRREQDLRRRTKVSTMASIDKELEEELLGAGNKLLDPPSSVDNLLDILIVSTLLISLSLSLFRFLR